MALSPAASLLAGVAGQSLDATTASRASSPCSGAQTYPEIDEGSLASSLTNFGWQLWAAGLKGQFDLQSGACSGRAVQLEAAAEGFGPVLKSDQAGAVAEVGAAATVVADAQAQDAVAGGHLDVGGGGAGVLGRVS
jgi:hypothetical protein